jgi:hypothetical protein
MKKAVAFLFTLLTLITLYSCKKNLEQKETQLTELPSVPACPPGQQWNTFLKKCVESCPAGYYFDFETESCLPSSGSTTTVNYAGVNIVYELNSKILRFNNVNDMNIVMDQLDTEYENHNTNYDNQYSAFTAEQLDSIDQVNNFDEFKKFRDFEALFTGYISKRSQIETTENTWLNNNLSGIDPDTLDFTFDEAENSVFNDSYRLKIGSTTYQMTQDGLVNVSSMAIQSVAADACITNKRRTQNFYDGDRAYKLKVAIHSILVRSSVKGKVVSFKQKSGGGYKRSRTQLAVSVAGTLYESGCITPTPLSKSNPTSGFKKRRQLKVRRGDAGITYRTKYGELGSRFDTPSSNGSSIINN